jgi:hypothetical protein
MSYEIEALVGKRELLAKHVLGLCHARVISLAQEVAIIPVTASFFQEVTGEATGRLYGFQYLSPPLAAWAERASLGGPVGYVEAVFCPAMGTQWGIVWQGAGIAAGPYSKDADAINKVLRLLGVRASGANDEFDTVGLGRCRSTSAWLVGESGSGDC